MAGLEAFTLETFSRRVGETFRLRQADSTSTLNLELLEVSRLGDVRGANTRAPFSIIFRGPLEFPLPQRIYRLEHADMDAFELFLVPIGPDNAGMRYEAVFS